MKIQICVTKLSQSLCLERAVEPVLPLIDQHVDRDQRQLDRDHGGEQAAAGPLSSERKYGAAIRQTIASVALMFFTELGLLRGCAQLPGAK